MAAARAKRRESVTASLITEVLGGLTAQRELPEPVAETLAALDAARRGEPVLAGARGRGHAPRGRRVGARLPGEPGGPSCPA